MHLAYVEGLGVRLWLRCNACGHSLTPESRGFAQQPILNDEDAIPFPPGSPNQAKFELVTQGTENVYRAAKKLGVKIVFGTDTLFDRELAKKQGKQLAKLKRWFTPAEALRQATSTAGELLALSGPRLGP